MLAIYIGEYNVLNYCAPLEFSWSWCFNYFLGFSPASSRGSYSYSRTSSPFNETIKSVSQNHLLDSYSCRINNGMTKKVSNSSLFLKKDNTSVLDAFDDEYEGVVVNPDQLPSNPHLFAYALRSSLHQWKLKVY